MNGNVEHYATWAVALITICITLCQAHEEGRTCSLLSRPHPNGFCGEKLAMAHRNLCFLIRRSYPQFFPIVKRSVPSSEDDRNSNPEVDVLGHGLNNYDLTSYLRQKEVTSSEEDFNNILLSSLTPQDVPEYPPQNQASSAFLDLLLQKHASRSKRSLVCECCYGPCTVRIIARYC